MILTRIFTHFRMSNVKNVSPLPHKTPSKVGVSNRKWCKNWCATKEKDVIIPHKLEVKPPVVIPPMSVAEEEKTDIPVEEMKSIVLGDEGESPFVTVEGEKEELPSVSVEEEKEEILVPPEETPVTVIDTIEQEKLYYEEILKSEMICAKSVFYAKEELISIPVEREEYIPLARLRPVDNKGQNDNLTNKKNKWGH